MLSEMHSHKKSEKKAKKSGPNVDFFFEIHEFSWIFSFWRSKNDEKLNQKNYMEKMTRHFLGNTYNTYTFFTWKLDVYET